MKVFSCSKLVGFVLSAVCFTSLPLRAQLVFQFESSGSDTVVTGSGSATSLPSFTGAPLVGYAADIPFVESLFTFGATPPVGWLDAPSDVSIGARIPAISTSLQLGNGGFTSNLIELGYRSGPMTNNAFFFLTDAAIPPSTLLTASGTAAFTHPAFDSLYTTYAPGSVIQIIPGVLHFVIGTVALPSTSPLAPRRTRRQRVATVLVADVGAIASAESSGIAMGLIHQQVVLGAADPVLRDLNTRLFRARSEQKKVLVNQPSASGRQSSLLRYLDFIRDEHQSYKVALGLADAEEREIVVALHDTLGRRFLGGGLPYAMMGVTNVPVVLGEATVRVVASVPSGKVVIDDSKAVVQNQSWKRWELFVAGDFSAYEQDQLSELMESFDTQTYAGSVGVEYRLRPWLNLGLVGSYLESDTQVAGDLGGIDLEGGMISAYATAFWSRHWMDLLYSYGTFDSEIRRNIGLGNMARGVTQSDSHRIRLNAGSNFDVSKNIVSGPIAGLRYAKGDLDAYSETGGGTAALHYRGTGFESMVSRLGWQASHTRGTGWGRIVSQVRGAWEHEFMPENSAVGVSLLTSPFALISENRVSRIGGYSTEGDGSHTGSDWLSAGAGLRFERDDGWALLFDYEGVFFRSDVAQHYGSVKVSHEW